MFPGHKERFHGVIVSPDEERDVLHAVGPHETESQAVQAAKDYINRIEKRDYFVESQDGKEVKVLTRRGHHCATIITEKW